MGWARSSPRANGQKSPQLAVAIFACALIAHGASIWCGWIWDDDSYVTANAIVQSSNGWLTLWAPGATPQYYPLVFLGFWIEHALFGLEPLWFHVVNVLMHASSATLLFTILRRLDVNHAFWIAAFFAVHPMGVESVAWVTERKNVQSMLFALLAIRSFLPIATQERGSGASAWLKSFAFFAAALLSKTTAVFVAPCLVFVLLWKRRSIDIGLAVRLAPFFITGAALGLFTASLERTHVGAVGGDFAISLLERLQLSGLIAAFYAKSFAMPVEQIFIYPRFAPDSTDLARWVPTLAIAGALVCSAWWWRRSRAPLLIMLWGGAALFPALGFFDVWPFRFSYVADHFAYAAMPCLATALIASIAMIPAAARAGRRVGVPAGVCTVVVLTLLSIRAIPKYESEETLWLDTLERNPSAWIAANNLSTIRLSRAAQRLEEGAREEALVLAQQALEYATQAGELKPDEFTNAFNRSEAHRLLGARDASLEEIERAARIAPELFDVQWTRGRALAAVDRLDEAGSAFRKAVGLAASPEESLRAHRELMRVALRQGSLDEALHACEQVVALAPEDADMIANLGSLLGAVGRKEEGRRTLLRAVELGRGGFSGDEAWIAARVGYIRAAIATPPVGDETARARAVAAELVGGSQGDPFAQYLELALALALGDQSARGRLLELGERARAEGNAALADEVIRFLSAEPRADTPLR
jgi:tetratricopeptide (TPR) repeat protein